MTYKCTNGIYTTTRFWTVCFELIASLGICGIVKHQARLKGFDPVSSLILIVLLLAYLVNYRWQLVLCDEGLIIKYLWRTQVIEWTKITYVERFGGYVLITHRGMNLLDWVSGLLSLAPRPTIRIAQIGYRNYINFVKQLPIDKDYTLPLK